MKVYGWGTWTYYLKVFLNGKTIFVWSVNNDSGSRYDDKYKYYYYYLNYVFTTANGPGSNTIGISSDADTSVEDLSTAFGISFMRFE